MKSLLHPILEQVQNESDFEKARKITVDHIDKCGMNEKDRKLMKVRVQYQIHTYDKLLMFLYNNILKFEGNGVIK